MKKIIICLIIFTSYGLSAQKTVEEYIDIGKEKSDLKDYYGAIAEFTKAIELNNYSWGYPYFLRGAAKADLNDYKGAVLDYTKAINIEENEGFYSSRAEAKVELKDFYGAIADYTKVIELDPNTPLFIYRARAELFRNLRDQKSLIKDLDIQLIA